MVAELGIAGLTALGVYAADIAARYSKTSHGANPWNFTAFYNALMIARHVERAVSTVGGKINVMFRSREVNAAVGGVNNSYHMLGLAVDIAPGKGFSPESGSRALYAAAVRGELGPARTIIWEPGWCHVDWHNPKDVGPPPPCRFFRKVGDKYETVKP